MELNRTSGRPPATMHAAVRLGPRPGRALLGAVLLALTGCANTTATPQTAPPSAGSQCPEADSTTVQAIVSGARQGDASMTVLASATVNAADGSQIIALSYLDQHRQPSKAREGLWQVRKPDIYSLTPEAHETTFWPLNPGDDDAVSEAHQCLNHQAPR
ncbi:hypothetical protein [Couchioplanes azureus]|uniref:hypothetical protein n=1 Tax=Couchioplanes caeruleus TaxID=56438 RepID=UPI001670A403|nr:hypothetical protein [Couchioplanes caeruleus]GGQ72279.1 hypothetical protein GCM10010166_47720 [Couchioplanes caeruleus subsp. azureus]